MAHQEDRGEPRRESNMLDCPRCGGTGSVRIKTDAEYEEAEQLREALTALCDAIPDYAAAVLNGWPSDHQRARLEVAFAQARAALKEKGNLDE